MTIELFIVGTDKPFPLPAQVLNYSRKDIIDSICNLAEVANINDSMDRIVSIQEEGRQVYGGYLSLFTPEKMGDK